MITSLSDAFAKSNLKSLQIGNFKIEQLEQRVNEQAEQLASQKKMLDDLALYSMAFYIYDKLKYLSLGTAAEYKAAFGEYKYVQDETFDHDLRYLRDHGYLELFQINCKHPSGTDLIFWPNLVPELPQDREPTAEEIADLALRDPTEPGSAPVQ